MPESSLPLTSTSLSVNTEQNNNGLIDVHAVTNSYPFWLGGMAASLAAICTHPLDMAKVRMQTGPPRSMLATLMNAVQVEGIRKGAYVGLSASLARQMTYSVTRFGVYDNLKFRLARYTGNPDTSKLPCHHLAIAASLAGAAGGLAGNPADVILVRMTSDINLPKESRKGYKNCFEALFRMIKEEGFGSLTRGLGPNLSRSILMNASQLATYDSIKEGLVNTKFFNEGLWLHFCASSMAGAIATTICSPFDVVKSRIMNTTPGSATVPQVIRQSFRNEGVGWIFRGWTPAFIRLGPNTVIIFVGLEQLKIATDYIKNR
ncbi:hypothetical protein Pst134EB_002235 [Puccinia striiformis f. sp. tritici]|uniref:Mitochondrial dicarboxylate transporter n=1 Tax=Puccinia striiformis f. sp. tritici PST-78 TaxID=1165861 RepID=A0A0L0VML5_9BASI|nr:hypothetical protein Pst134EB_002235 [Puccinia striiformis f. sp. tritici]KNF00275.1 hypothetical protein PSTG_06447 [Puccinia striiformis f. sp. tritici PST-78]